MEVQGGSHEHGIIVVGNIIFNTKFSKGISTNWDCIISKHYLQTADTFAKHCELVHYFF